MDLHASNRSLFFNRTRESLTLSPFMLRILEHAIPKPLNTRILRTQEAGNWRGRRTETGSPGGALNARWRSASRGNEVLNNSLPGDEPIRGTGSGETRGRDSCSGYCGYLPLLRDKLYSSVTGMGMLRQQAHSGDGVNLSEQMWDTPTGVPGSKLQDAKATSKVKTGACWQSTLEHLATAVAQLS